MFSVVVWHSLGNSRGHAAQEEESAAAKKGNVSDGYPAHRVGKVGKWTESVRLVRLGIFGKHSEVVVGGRLGHVIG